MNSATAVQILKFASNIVACSCRALEILMVIFLTVQFFKRQSNFRSAYFIILNVGYISDLSLFINWIYPMDTITYYYSLILVKWHNTYFLIIWNTALCLNRCTALAFSFKHEKLWTPRKMIFIVTFMVLFPFIIDGYKFINFPCSLSTTAPCLIFRSNYYFKGLIVSGIFNCGTFGFIIFSMHRSRSNKIQVHSLHAKIERRLIYQAIFSSIFQMLYFILNYVSSTVNDNNVLWIYVYSSTIGYHFQHYAVMITHFIFSPTFKKAFFNFYFLKFFNLLNLKNKKNSVKVVTTISKQIKISVPIRTA